MQWRTELVENFYIESPDDSCVGSFAETPFASIDFNIPSASKSKGQRKRSKGKNWQKQMERKNVVTKDIRSFFGGLTIVKLSGQLNSKKKKKNNNNNNNNNNN